MSLAYITHPSCALHEMGSYHPERPARLSAINDRMIASGLEVVMTHVEAPPATVEQLCRVHDARYVDRVLTAWPRAGSGNGGDNGSGDGRRYIAFDPDTSMNPHTAEAALRAAGAVVSAVDLVSAGTATRAFCAVRPPGHHACYDRAMGFCFFNNVAVGAAHAISRHGKRRVAIVDFDVHHGNGTENIVSRIWPWWPPAARGTRSDAQVLFCSVFQHPFYPYSGSDTEAPNIVNVPLPAGTAGGQFREAIEAQWLPAIDAFAPDLILVSAGFDGHALDEMSGWQLDESDYRWITEQLVAVAARHAHGRMVSVLEGGYELGSLGRCAAGHLQAMI